jgi:hypothetical protein
MHNEVSDDDDDGDDDNDDDDNVHDVHDADADDADADVRSVIIKNDRDNNGNNIMKMNIKLKL